MNPLSVSAIKVHVFKGFNLRLVRENDAGHALLCSSQKYSCVFPCCRVITGVFYLECFHSTGKPSRAVEMEKERES